MTGLKSELQIKFGETRSIGGLQFKLFLKLVPRSDKHIWLANLSKIHNNGSSGQIDMRAPVSQDSISLALHCDREKGL